MKTFISIETWITEVTRIVSTAIALMEIEAAREMEMAATVVTFPHRNDR